MIRDPIRYAILAAFLLAIDLTVRDIPAKTESIPLRCLLDSLSHLVIAVIAWFMVRSCTVDIILTDRLIVMEALVCGLLSSMLDIDHFIEAESFDLTSATSLQTRPFLHCSSLLVMVFVIMLLASLSFRIGSLHTFSFLCLTAWSTHHLRDGLRRGLWFCPIAQTGRLDSTTYIVILLLLPLAVSYLLDLTAIILVFRKKADTVLAKRRNSTESEKLLMQDVV